MLFEGKTVSSKFEFITKNACLKELGLGLTHINSIFALAEVIHSNSPLSLLFLSVGPAGGCRTHTSVSTTTAR